MYVLQDAAALCHGLQLKLQAEESLPPAMAAAASKRNSEKRNGRMVIS